MQNALNIKEEKIQLKAGSKHILKNSTASLMGMWEAIILKIYKIKEFERSTYHWILEGNLKKKSPRTKEKLIPGSQPNNKEFRGEERSTGIVTMIWHTSQVSPLC